MASSSFYDTHFTMLVTMLTSLEGILTKAEAHAKENNIDFNAEYAPARLFEDMYPLTFQVQTVSNTIKGFVKIVLGVEVGTWDDNETTFEQLFARIKKTRDLTDGLRPEDVNGKENLQVEGKAGPLAYKTTGITYASTFTIPNTFFHLQTAYAILRMKGVPLSKRDYLVPFMLCDPGNPFGQK
ncbi:hypothetical protein KVR01_008218 [Diaporthe batatas]|uniref:uncharacterized protein n=1 Tax=Diaporthe batatas TaxID=748121 RepID=UPI001D05BC16|nr:uncharacterized protein KVR01_008218 [Diaporthe batatas]KAG8162453.1 hypothetical protein KVR01_008218 [Diaporthe batatas]